MTSDSNNTAKQMDVLIPNNFQNNSNYIPIAQLNSINGQQLPAIGQYTAAAPDTGTYVLGSIDGVIQWIQTQAC